jgi:hypothetical protein
MKTGRVLGVNVFDFRYLWVSGFFILLVCTFIILKTSLIKDHSRNICFSE